MAKPIEYIVELDAKHSGEFLARWLAKTPNPARDATVERAKNLKIELR